MLILTQLDRESGICHVPWLYVNQQHWTLKCGVFLDDTLILILTFSTCVPWTSIWSVLTRKTQGITED